MNRTRTLALTALAGLALLAVTSPLWSQAPDAPAGNQPINLLVRLPANAVLEINGVPTRQTGAVRRFISPTLPPARNYYYVVKATWKDGDEDKVVEQRVYVEIGKETEIDLRPSPSPSKVVGTEPKVTTEDKPRFIVPYVPTPQEVVEKMLEMAEVGKDDVVYDLGCGDGRIVVTAAKKYGAKGVGVDINPDRVKESEDNAKKEGVEDRVTIRKGDVLKTDVAPATVVTLYLQPNVNLALKPILQKSLKPGARIVSHDFDMGDDWKPVKTEKVTDSDGLDHTLYLWKIEAGADKEAAKPKVVKDEDIDLPVPYVPTPQEVVDEMLKLAEVGKNDVVYDLGCGDGRIVVTAAKKYGARGVGVDLDPVRVKESIDNVKKNNVEELVTIRKGDALKTDVSPATVVTLYLLPEVNEQLRPTLQKTLKPGTRIVSHDFEIGDWKPLKTVEVKGPRRSHTLYLWKIEAPADKDDKKEDRKPDVIFVPTPQEVVDEMLKLAGVKKGDVLYDLGCGDGRIPVTAAKQFGVKAFGFDIDPERIKESLANVKKNKVEDLVTIKKQDIFTLDLKEASVVTLYLLPELNVKLIPQLEKMKPGSRIVSHDFDMQGAKPDKEVKVKLKDGGESTVYLWTIPLTREPDVIFVPTPQEVVDKMLELAGVKKGDVLYDLGCGDGRIPVTAAKQFGVKAFGFDIDPERIKESNDNVKKNKVEDLVTIKKQDIFALDLKDASVVTLYLLPELNVKLIPQLEKLKPGSRIVSHDFDMKGVKPDKEVKVKTKDGQESTIYLWTVPLKKVKEAPKEEE